jgi:polysaccharide export outer membrane protein
MAGIVAGSNSMSAVGGRSAALSSKRIAVWKRLLVLALSAFVTSGCRFVDHSSGEIDPASVVAPPQAPMPTEPRMVSLPPYIIEPPDVLDIAAVKTVPKAPYKIEALDYLTINASGTLPPELRNLGAEPITGTYAVEPGGSVNLGASYGRVNVQGLTVEEAAEAIYHQLSRVLTAPQVSVTLAASSGLQPISGEHRVGLDGTVNLGTYGTVYVTGMTVEQAKKAIEDHLSQFLEAPEVSVDVFNYASKVYYIIGQGAGFGDQAIRVPITGKETVLDAISEVGGIRQYQQKKIWIARPTPGGCGCDQILPVKWDEITRGGSTATNYQIMPGDRIYISEDKLIALNSLINKVLNPFERIFGFTTLATQGVETIKHPGLSLTGNNSNVR